MISIRYMIFSKRKLLFKLLQTVSFLTKGQRKGLFSELRLERNRKYADRIRFIFRARNFKKNQYIFGLSSIIHFRIFDYLH